MDYIKGLPLAPHRCRSAPHQLPLATAVCSLITRNEERLQATMTDEQKELFAQYMDAVREYQTIAECLLFQNSFKLGARMMLEVMGE